MGLISQPTLGMWFASVKGWFGEGCRCELLAASIHSGWGIGASLGRKDLGRILKGLLQVVSSQSA